MKRAFHEIIFILKRDGFIAKVSEHLYISNRDEPQMSIKHSIRNGNTYIIYRELAAMNGMNYADNFLQNNGKYKAPYNIVKRAKICSERYVDSHKDIIPTV